jgi:signal transduction histidine kinase
MLSRLRRPVGRLGDLPVWAKLGLIMIVPTVATIVVGTFGLVDHVATANNADRARTLSSLSADVGALVHRLQDERAAATMLLSVNNPANVVQANTAAYQKRWSETDQAKNAYALRRTGLADLPPTFKDLLGRLDTQLSELPALRQDVAGRKSVSLTYAAFTYQGLIADLLAIRDLSAQIAGETSLSDRMRAAAAVSNMKEFLSQERIVVLRAFGEGQLLPARRRDFIATLTGQLQARSAFNVVATPAERNFFEQTHAGVELRLAEKYEGQVESLGEGDLRLVGFNAAQWDAALHDRAELLRKIETSMDRTMEVQATGLRDTVQRQVLIESGLLLGMLLLAVLFAWLIARSMARSLRELRNGALAVATYGLPQAVARLRDPALATQMSPQQIAHQIAEPLPVHTKDEFGQVTDAFNAVHMEAVRTAAEQAALRSSVATMFVNLARRSQLLVDRLIGHLDRLERGEEDPDRLAELFQLDHLATRMRRNDENLLVLAGADSTRVQREPAPLIDVLRAAQSEVEHYTRIEFGVIDRDIEVAAHAVNDVVHLVAELLDNATAFSPPDSAVIVEARRMGDRAVLLVEDRGIGITPDQIHELNERLATPPMVDVAVSRMMGLVVVARLAARHGVKVELRPAVERGTIADLTLPTSVLVPRALVGRMHEPAEMAGHAGQPAAPPRMLGAPLALESGPSTGAVPVPNFGWTGESHPMPRPFDPTHSRPFETPAPSGPRLFDSPDQGHRGPARALPAWSDLTGASGSNGADVYGGTRRPGGAPSGGVPGNDPLPQRRPDGRTVDGEITGGTPLIPRQHPTDFGGNGARSDIDDYARPVSGPPSMPVPPPYSAAPLIPPAAAAPSIPPAAAMPPSIPSPSAFRPDAPPPVWPPVAPAPEYAPEVPPAVPEEFVAALDMTAEIPRVPVDEATGGYAQREYPPPGYAPARAGENRPRFVDETMELPIFRELESAWFRTRRSVPEEVFSSEGASALVSDYDQPTPARPPSSGSLRVPPLVEAPPVAEPLDSLRDRTPSIPVSETWETAADDGWRAATAASERPVAEVTDSGLPKRVPMAQLVPGGVDKSAGTAHRRTPEAVRGLLSAYHRGVQRGRTQQPKSAPDGPDASKTPEPAGKEQEA